MGDASGQPKLCWLCLHRGPHLSLQTSLTGRSISFSPRSHQEVEQRPLMYKAGVPGKDVGSSGQGLQGCVSPLYPAACWSQLAPIEKSPFFPTPCLSTSLWQLAVGHSGGVYTMEIGKGDHQGFYFSGERLVQHYWYTTSLLCVASFPPQD